MNKLLINTLLYLLVGAFTAAVVLYGFYFAYLNLGYRIEDTKVTLALFTTVIAVITACAFVVPRIQRRVFKTTAIPKKISIDYSSLYEKVIYLVSFGMAAYFMVYLVFNSIVWGLVGMFVVVGIGLYLLPIFRKTPK